MSKHKRDGHHDAGHAVFHAGAIAQERGGRVASVGLWLALFLALLYLTPIVPKGVLSVTLPDKDTVQPNLWAFSPDGKLLVTADDGLTREWQAPASLPLGPVDVWDVETRQKRFTLAENAFYVEEVLFSPDSKLSLFRVRTRTSS